MPKVEPAPPEFPNGPDEYGYVYVEFRNLYVFLKPGETAKHAREREMRANLDRLRPFLKASMKCGFSRVQGHVDKKKIRVFSAPNP